VEDGFKLRRGLGDNGRNLKVPRKAGIKGNTKTKKTLDRGNGFVVDRITKLNNVILSAAGKTDESRLVNVKRPTRTPRGNGI
jgi:hypothetical protein